MAFEDLPEVILIPESTTPETLGELLVKGVMPPGSSGMTFEAFSKIGRVDDCDCKLIQCVCEQARLHKKDCPYRFSMTCAIPIACDEHGLDVCSICTPCTCD